MLPLISIVWNLLFSKAFLQSCCEFKSLSRKRYGRSWNSMSLFACPVILITLIKLLADFGKSWYSKSRVIKQKDTTAPISLVLLLLLIGCVHLWQCLLQSFLLLPEEWVWVGLDSSIGNDGFACGTGNSSWDAALGASKQNKNHWTALINQNCSLK